MNGNWEDNIMMVAKFYKALGYNLKDIKSTNNGLEPVVGAIAGMLERISTPTIEDFYEYKTLEYLAEQLKKDSSTITGSMLERMLGDKKEPEIENCSKDLEKNILYVSQGEDDLLFSNGLYASGMNWIPTIPEEKSFNCFAKFRYRQPDQKVSVTIIDKDKIKVDFDEKQRAITPGQFVVLYNEDGICLGGGIIDESFKK